MRLMKMNLFKCSVRESYLSATLCSFYDPVKLDTTECYFSCIIIKLNNIYKFHLNQSSLELLNNTLINFWQQTNVF